MLRSETAATSPKLFVSPWVSMIGVSMAETLVYRHRPVVSPAGDLWLILEDESHEVRFLDTCGTEANRWPPKEVVGLICFARRRAWRVGEESIEGEHGRRVVVE